MNVYDFDKTIYTGDSTARFYMHCLLKYPQILKTVPQMLIKFIQHKSGSCTLTEFKETMYSFLTCVPDIDKEVKEFWDKAENMSRIKKYYLNQQSDDDVVISASPEFLLSPLCEKLGIKTLMASVVDKKTGKYQGVNCRDKEKVRRFYEWKPDGVIDKFYSDSLADTPLAEIAKEAYIVNGNAIKSWPKA